MNRTIALRALGIALVALGGWAFPAAADQRSLPDPLPCPGCWRPALQTEWQWQLTRPVDESVDVAMYDIDLFENSSEVVASLHSSGRKVVCYVDAGTWENFRPDADQFPDSVKGRHNGWPGERWLDVRRMDVLKPIMRARLDQCEEKGFDGVEFDNVDGYANNTGFPLTAHDQLVYNTWLANSAHERGLSAALKNDLDQVTKLLPYFDFALDEQCFQYEECDALRPFIDAGKAVFEVEYKLDTSQFCSRTNAMDFNSMKKRLSLNAWRRPCR
jgi:hypothetical protein